MRKYFKEWERYQLEALLKAKTPVKEICNILKRSKTCIYREIKNGTVEMLDSNLKPYTKYCADRGQQVQDEKSHSKGREPKIGNDLDFVKFIESRHTSIKTTLLLKQKSVLKQSITMSTTAFS